jgi:hypothetical protein
MNKIILKPSECGHQSDSTTIRISQEGSVPLCCHFKAAYPFPCTKKDKWPKNCPLENGYTFKQILNLLNIE